MSWQWCQLMKLRSNVTTPKNQAGKIYKLGRLYGSSVIITAKKIKCCEYEATYVYSKEKNGQKE